MATMYVSTFLDQLPTLSTAGTVIERSTVISALQDYCYKLAPVMQNDLVLSTSYLVQDHDSPTGYKGIMKTDTFVDAGGVDCRCISIITRMDHGKGDIVESLCIKASNTLLIGIFGKDPITVDLKASDPVPPIYTSTQPAEASDITHVEVKNEPKPDLTEEDLERLTAPTQVSNTPQDTAPEIQFEPQKRQIPTAPTHEQKPKQKQQVKQTKQDTPTKQDLSVATL